MGTKDFISHHTYLKLSPPYMTLNRNLFGFCQPKGKKTLYKLTMCLPKGKKIREYKL